jgi:DNA invertase Pin-like site-specific DNA recombinase
MSGAIVYVRVSSDEQNKGSSPDDQSRRCIDYSRMQALTVVAEIRDDYTGYEFERPGFDKVREMIAKGQADTLICLSGDRLARSVFVVTRMITEFLRRYRVNLHFVSRGRIDYDSPEGEFIMLMEAVGNQYWGTKAKEIMKNGRRALVQDGIKPGQGPNLYGYTKLGDRRETRYEIDELAAVIIRRIFSEVVTGKAILAIARDLTEEGVPTPSQYAKMQKVKRKDYGIWTPKILHRILKNEAYTGTLWLNRTVGTHGKDLQYIPREKWVPVPMPPIIDRALFDAARAALAGHISVLRDGGAYRQTFLMAGLVRCEHCATRGRSGNIVTPMMRKSKGRSYAYYICNKSLLPYLQKEERCPLPSIPRDKLDNAVWRFIDALYENPDAVLASFQEAQVERRRKNAVIEAKIAGLEQTLAEQRTKQENLWLEVASLPRDATNAKMALRNVITHLDEAIAESLAEIMALRADLVPVPDDGALTVFWEYRDGIREGVRKADTIEKRRRVIDALNMTVSVEGVAGKPKATLHWWGIDTPLSLEEETPGGQGPAGLGSAPTYGADGNGGGDIPILWAEWHMRFLLRLAIVVCFVIRRCAPSCCGGPAAGSTHPSTAEGRRARGGVQPTKTIPTIPHTASTPTQTTAASASNER